MYSVVNKVLYVALLAVILSACGNADREAALQLTQDAENEVKAGNYDEAIALLDTLDNRYAAEVEIRRSAMKYRAMAVEGVTIRRISAVDDTLAQLKAKLDQFETKFDYVTNPGKGLGGNFIAKSLTKGNYDILPRINDEGYFTISVKIGKSIGFEYIKFISKDGTVSTKPIDASRLVKVESNEMTVLQQEDADDAIKWLTGNDADAYELVGSKSTVKQKLTPAMREAIVETWQFAEAKQSYRLALITREKLERKLQLCRDQLANVIDR